MKWEDNAELRLRPLFQLDLCQYHLSDQYINARQSAIVFGNNMKRMPLLTGIGGDQRHKYLEIDGNYQRFYYLANDHSGKIVLRLNCGYPVYRF